MAEIKIRDYEDEFGWGVNVIGMGLNHSSNIVPQIESAVESGEKEITIKINTCGGSVWCSLAIANALKVAKEKGVKIITVNEGICASAGTPIFMEGDERIVYTSLFMIHKPQGFWCGLMTDEDMKREGEALKIHQDTLLLTYSATGLDDATLTDMINAETWLTPALCLSLGFATEDRSKPDQKADVLESSMTSVSKTSPENRVYAQKYFNTIPLKNNQMNVQEALRQSAETQKKTNSLLGDIAKFFKNLVTDEPVTDEVTNASSDLSSGDKVYYDGVLGVGTEVFSDEAMTEHLSEGDHDLADGNFITVDASGLVTVMEKKEDPIEDSEEVTDLKNEVESLKTALEASNASLNASNEALTKIKNIKSTYTPPSREQKPDPAKNSGLVGDGKLDLSDAARQARREEREKIKTNKIKK